MQKYEIALYIRLSIEDYKYDSLSIENQSLVLHVSSAFWREMPTSSASPPGAERRRRNCAAFCGRPWTVRSSRP